MNSPRSDTHLIPRLIWMVFAFGSSGTHAQNPSATLLAQAAPADCRLGDSTMLCCIKKHPHDPVGACGATPSDLDAAVRAGARLEQALQRRTGDDAEEEDEEADDPDEGWREHCRDTYVQCRGQMNPRWKGDCYACFRLCEGQRQWPFHLCKPQT